ncbi:MAG: hypothetical protein CVV24_04785 [Ignavibacteriae bacterium HGW-Ignavibacteriae-3]|nr:MAG: hypothetical protein CVV24_04785 [Ignavibacteriae bacterium HGW-Ignavibacteriae-3]
MPEKIKICHICDRITGTADGVFSHLLMLLNNIDKDRYEQIVIYQGGKVVEHELSKIGIKTFVVSGLNDRFSVNAIVKIFKILSSENVNVIHAHLLKPYILVGLLNIFLRKKFIFNYNGLFINSVYHNWIERLVLRGFHLIIYLFTANNIVVVPSKASKYLLQMETRLFAKIEVYYNGYDNQTSDNPNIKIVEYLRTKKTNHFLVGIVSRLEGQKRVDLSLWILNELIQRNYRVFFVFLGDGPLEKEMKLFAKSLGVYNNCEFYGFVKNAKNYLKYFDAILFASDWEGLPLTYWESMANSVPIISTDVGGAREILIENDCGIVYPRGDVEEGVKAIEILIKDEKLRIQLGENGRRAVQTKYNLNSFKSFFENLYRQLAM